MFSPNRIDVDNEAEVMLWADNLSLSVDELRDIVTKVGPMVVAVTYYARKSAKDRDEAGTSAARTRSPVRPRR